MEVGKDNEQQEETLQSEENLWDAELPLIDFLVPKRFGEGLSPTSGFALLSGPPKCGKTSLLLQLAYNLALDDLARVVFLCKPRNFENDYIYLSQGLDTSSQVFDRIHIKYINDDGDLRKYFAAFHMHVDLPTAVLVDDFVDYFGERSEGVRVAQEKSIVKTMCLCCSAVQYANDKAASNLGCALVISDTHHGDGPRLLYIFKKYISKVFVIKALESKSMFTLEIEDMQDGRNGENDGVVGRFALGDDLLHFHGLEAKCKPVDFHEHASSSH